MLKRFGWKRMDYSLLGLGGDSGLNWSDMEESWVDWVESERECKDFLRSGLPVRLIHQRMVCRQMIQMTLSRKDAAQNTTAAKQEPKNSESGSRAYQKEKSSRK